MTVDTAVVLAAGEGKRLRPLTEHRPKPMLPAGTRPILEYVLDALLEAGVSDLHLVVGYGRDRIQNHVGSTYRGRPVTYHDQRKQLGSGHALLQAADAVETECLVVNGDQVVSTAIVRDVVAAHTSEDVATLAVVESDAAPDYGAVRLDGDRVVELHERPGGEDHHLLNAGVYAFDRSFFEEIERTPREEGELSLTRTIAWLAAEERSVRGVHTDGVWRDAVYPWDLLSLARTVLRNDDILTEAIPNGGGSVTERSGRDGRGPRDRREERNGRGRRRVRVSPTASVHEDATLVGPVDVADDCVVGPGAVVGPNVALGRNTTVRAGAVVRGSVVDVDARIGENATVVDAVVGQGVHVGPGVTLPGGAADVRIGTTVHEDCRLGGVLADRVHVGGGATVLPGALVGPDARVDPGTVVRGQVEAHGRVSN
ncbi:sugar phosphate nucleotidyltransferase [Halobium salinum]|uniref:Bifunctional protein GlmU n=1 Tax=Halobium salinum TaxID=1364940 RepID=A0ABD5PBB1_9EURY|nr:sugar phosphate nucleotidyltransferase [Halobium salinum]